MRRARWQRAIFLAAATLAAPSLLGASQRGPLLFASSRGLPRRHGPAGLCGAAPRAPPRRHGPGPRGCPHAAPRVSRGSYVGIVGKLHHTLDDSHAGWRVRLAEGLEGRHALGLVVLLIMIDLFLTGCVHVAENTRLLNPALGEQIERFVERSKQVGLLILNAFVLEQLFHIVAFGSSYFRKPWLVLDLAVVSISLFVELREMREEKRQSEGKQMGRSKTRTAARLLMVMRMWKLVAFAFDVLLARHLATSMNTSGAYIKHLEAELLRRGIPLPTI